jgi:hypothetical protein
VRLQCDTIRDASGEQHVDVGRAVATAHRELADGDG